MAYIGSVQKCTGTGGTTTVTVEPTKFTEGIPKDLQRIRITNSVTLPAGALSIEVLPKEYGKEITVNGVDHYLNDRFHREKTEDKTTCKVYFVKEVVIVATGQYNLAVSYPEGHSVDFTALGL